MSAQSNAYSKIYTAAATNPINSDPKLEGEGVLIIWVG